MIRVDITQRRRVPTLITRHEAARLVTAALTTAGAPSDGSVALILTDDAELTGLNETHMGATGPTDVLSFPLLPPAAFPAHEGQDPAVRASAPGSVPFALPPDEPVHLGDIVISVERAVEQAAEGRGGQTGDVAWSARHELRLLIVHGALHLCGWDHAEPAEEAAMRALERSILDEAAAEGR
jgi:probable rRNA maturation factor